MRQIRDEVLKSSRPGTSDQSPLDIVLLLLRQDCSPYITEGSAGKRVP